MFLRNQVLGFHFGEQARILASLETEINFGPLYGFGDLERDLSGEVSGPPSHYMANFLPNIDVLDVFGRVVEKVQSDERLRCERILSILDTEVRTCGLCFFFRRGTHSL